MYDNSNQNLVYQLKVVHHIPKNLSSWQKIPILANQNILIISVLQISAYKQSGIFSPNVLNRKSKQIILLNENDPVESKQKDNLVELIVTKQFTAIFLQILIDKSKFIHRIHRIIVMNPTN